jgi:hypothetical protein
MLARSIKAIIDGVDSTPPPPNNPGCRSVRFGSWLCENAKTLDGNRRSYASKTVLVLKLESALNSKDELKNVILAAFRSFAFLHSQGHSRPTLVTSPAGQCLLFPEGDLIAVRQRNDVTGQEETS